MRYKPPQRRSIKNFDQVDFSWSQYDKAHSPTSIAPWFLGLWRVLAKHRGEDSELIWASTPEAFLLMVSDWLAASGWIFPEGKSPLGCSTGEEKCLKKEQQATEKSGRSELQGF